MFSNGIHEELQWVAVPVAAILTKFLAPMISDVAPQSPL